MSCAAPVGRHVSLKNLMLECPGWTPAAAERAFERVAFQWGGTRVYMKPQACKRPCSENGPSRGGAAHLAAAIEAAILAEGGAAVHVKAVLVALIGGRVWVDG